MPNLKELKSKVKTKWDEYQAQRKANIDEKKEWKQTQDEEYRKSFREAKVQALKEKAVSDAYKKVYRGGIGSQIVHSIGKKLVAHGQNIAKKSRPATKYVYRTESVAKDDNKARKASKVVSRARSPSIPFATQGNVPSFLTPYMKKKRR